MEFCPECRSMMIPVEGKFICRKCGYEKEKGKSSFVSKHARSRGEIAVVGEEAAGLPTTRVTCPSCGNDTAYWWLRQLRGADESETRFFRCTKCKKTWREYD
ncbi:MAG: transcription factor S [Candidatus Syntropharchaeia archaeon]